MVEVLVWPYCSREFPNLCLFYAYCRLVFNINLQYEGYPCSELAALLPSLDS